MTRLNKRIDNYDDGKAFTTIKVFSKYSLPKYIKFNLACIAYSYSHTLTLREWLYKESSKNACASGSLINNLEKAISRLGENATIEYQFLLLTSGDKFEYFTIDQHVVEDSLVLKKPSTFDNLFDCVATLATL